MTKVRQIMEMDRAQPVSVTVSQTAPLPERFAAAELCRYLGKATATDGHKVLSCQGGARAGNGGLVHGVGEGPGPSCGNRWLSAGQGAASGSLMKPTLFRPALDASASVCAT